MEDLLKHRIAVLASGRGTNAEALHRYFLETYARSPICCIISDRRHAPVLEKAHRWKVPGIVVPPPQLASSLLTIFQENQITAVVLAGFLRKIPPVIVRTYRYRMINLHPSLLPRYGGKGMYGSRVFQAVWDAREPVSGITIHHVTEEYDEGPPLFQASLPLYEVRSLEELETRTHQMEHFYLPRIVDLWLRWIPPQCPLKEEEEYPGG